jgi:hypothetical protein
MRVQRTRRPRFSRRFPNAAELRQVLTPATPGRSAIARRKRIASTSGSPEEEAEMARTAEAFGLGVSEYLLRLHRLTVAIGHGRRGRSK